MNDGKKKQAQKHQNKTAYKIQFDPLSQQIHKKVSFRGLCKRCKEQLQWRIQYNKYKKMTEPAKCNFCHSKNVLRTYMRACEACSESLKTCPKCLTPETEEQVSTHLNEREEKSKQAEDQRKMNQFLKTLKERSRRTVKRLYEKNAIHWSTQNNNFIDEEGNIVPLHFRQGYDEKNSKDEDVQGSNEEFSDAEGSEQSQQDKKEQEKKINKKEKNQNNSLSKKQDTQNCEDGQNQEEQWEDIDSTQKQ